MDTERRGHEMNIHPAIAEKMAAARRKAAALPERIRALHAGQYPDCTAYGETWTETHVPLMGGGHGDITYTGCRRHCCQTALIEAR